MDPMSFIRNDLVYLFIDTLVVCLFFLSFASRNTEKTAIATYTAAAIVLKLIIFIGLRPFNAGNDTIGYYYTFQALEGVTTAREIGGWYGATEVAGELLYWPFAALIKPLIGDSFRLFLIASILITAYLTYLGNKKLVYLNNSDYNSTNNIALPIILTYLIFLSYEIAYFGGHIRSAFGVPIALISYYFALKRNITLTAITFFFAIGFHNSAISILPLLLVEILTPKINKTFKSTTIVITLLLFSFVFGKFNGISTVIGAIGGYYSDRYVAYAEYEGFNISSVFSTVYFWIILTHLAIFIVIGFKKVHFYAFYYMCLILAFSSTPKISERFFAYILVCLPFLLFTSLRTRFSERKSIILTVAISYIFSPLVITSYGVTSSLSIHSFIFPRHN